MPVLEDVEQKTPNDPEFLFHCPGCKMDHWFKTTGDEPRCVWNGDRVNPTVNPSIRVRVSDVQVCHFYIREGRILYCSDSWHNLKSRTVNMQEIEHAR